MSSPAQSLDLVGPFKIEKKAITFEGTVAANEPRRSSHAKIPCAKTPTAAGSDADNRCQHLRCCVLSYHNLPVHMNKFKDILHFMMIWMGSRTGCLAKASSASFGHKVIIEVRNSGPGELTFTGHMLC